MPQPSLLARRLRATVIGCLAVVAGLAATTSPARAAEPTATPAARADGDGGLRVVNYNILHGIFCDDGTDCQAHDRVDLFLRQLEDADCPEVVGLQEVNDNLRARFADRLPDVCGGRYRQVLTEADANDSELVLTTLKPGRSTILVLPGRLRTASRVELTGPDGPVVLVVTHQDGDKTFPSCRDDIDRYKCPPPCPAGTTYSECQTILSERLAARGGPKHALRILMGDFNVPAGAPRYARLLADGWIDTHLAAGNPECDPATGVECTAGRDDKSIAALKDPTAREQERIDFIFVKAPRGCRPVFDPVTDADADGLGTGLFAAAPATDGPGGLVWPSDHTAVSMDVSCATTST
ncbi:MAG: hypothetical protein FJW95_07650 [Actinobacteria bacterium]|nr:hypothetical protein [Actinomycetota bacterium]